jgi:hypothetical protein
MSGGKKIYVNACVEKPSYQCWGEDDCDVDLCQADDS